MWEASCEAAADAVDAFSEINFRDNQLHAPFDLIQLFFQLKECSTLFSRKPAPWRTS
jgi:hypothetical protein